MILASITKREARTLVDALGAYIRDINGMLESQAFSLNADQRTYLDGELIEAVRLQIRFREIRNDQNAQGERLL